MQPMKWRAANVRPLFVILNKVFKVSKLSLFKLKFIIGFVDRVIYHNCFDAGPRILQAYPKKRKKNELRE